METGSNSACYYHQNLAEQSYHNISARGLNRAFCIPFCPDGNHKASTRQSSAFQEFKRPALFALLAQQKKKIGRGATLPSLAATGTMVCRSTQQHEDWPLFAGWIPKSVEAVFKKVQIGNKSWPKVLPVS